MDEIFQREGAITAVPINGLTDIIRRLKGHGLKLGIATSANNRPPARKSPYMGSGTCSEI